MAKTESVEKGFSRRLNLVKTKLGESGIGRKQNWANFCEIGQNGLRLHSAQIFFKNIIQTVSLTLTTTRTFTHISVHLFKMIADNCLLERIFRSVPAFARENYAREIPYRYLTILAACCPLNFAFC